MVALSAPKFPGVLGPLDKDDCAHAVELSVKATAMIRGIMGFMSLFPSPVSAINRARAFPFPCQTRMRSVQLRTHHFGKSGAQRNEGCEAQLAFQTQMRAV